MKILLFLHARSFAGNIHVYEDDRTFTGNIPVSNGQLDLSGSGSLYLTGESLLHSAPLSTEAFKKGLLGDWGQYIIPLSLLLFAFTTSVAWSYYGDRAVTYLWGSKYVKFFHIVYVGTYFLASFTDTSIVWAFSGITVALMTLPNLIGILFLHKEVKSSIREYWQKMSSRS